MSQKLSAPISPLGALLLIAICSQCEAAELKMQHIPADFGASPKILGGAPATRADWPATLIFTTDSGDYCTATVIGEQILVTAAHCVISDSIGQVTWNNDHIKVNCTPDQDYVDSPRFPGDLPCHLRLYPYEFAACTADVALCVIAKTSDIKKFAPSVGHYERIKRAAPAALAGQKITLLGYGCVNPSIKLNGVLSFGSAKINHMSSPDASADHDPTLSRFILTEGAGVCNGDSGGAGYSSADKNTREIVGINSRGNLTKGSDLVNAVDARIVSFFQQFRTKNTTVICGLDDLAKNCAF